VFNYWCLRLVIIVSNLAINVVICLIGDVVEVRDVDEYIVKIPHDNGIDVRLGQFVKINAANGIIMGVISHMSSTAREELMPYISKEQRSRYVPYLDEYAMNYIVMHALGIMQAEGASDADDLISYSVDMVPGIGIEVELANSDDILRFHTVNGKHTFSYLNLQKSKLDSRVVVNMISQLEAVMPENVHMLASLKHYIQMGGV